MNLIKSILWLELRRIRTYLIILAIALIGTTFLLGIDGSVDLTHVEFNINSDNSKVTDLLHVDQFIQLIPLWLILCASSIVGFVIAIILPVRSDQDWRGGQFQMLRLSKWNSWQILASRGLVYCAIIWIFYTVLSLLTIVGVQVQKIQISGLSYDLLLAMQIIVLSLAPALISLGILVDALRTAYYQNGLKWVHSSIQFFIWLVLLGFLTDMHRKFAGVLFPKITFPSIGFIEQASGKSFNLYWEPILISWLLAVILLAISGQILKEVEA